MANHKLPTTKDEKCLANIGLYLGSSLWNYTSDTI